MNTRATLDRDLKDLRFEIRRMAELVDRAVERAFRSLRLHDSKLAASVVAEDQNIDIMRIEIESRATTILALQQPVTHDQRVVVAAMMIAMELERIADHAAGISRTVARATYGFENDYPKQLSQMSQIVRDMVKKAVECFSTEQLDEARQTAERDYEVDALYMELFNMLIEQMTEQSLAVDKGTYLMWAGHNLERIGDRATNICERVIYAGTGSIADLNPKKEPEELEEYIRDDD